MSARKPTPNWDDLGYMGRGRGGYGDRVIARDRVIRKLEPGALIYADPSRSPGGVLTDVD
jgi:hypothetical protein